MKQGDTVRFTDKTGEVLTGKVTNLNFEGDEAIIVVDCFKPSWGMSVSCIVPKDKVVVLQRSSYREREWQHFLNTCTKKS